MHSNAIHSFVKITVPPSNEDLPNLENLIGTLEEGDSELHTEREPPTLFHRPEHEPSYRQISTLRQEIEEEPIDPYIDHFEDNVRDDVLMIGNISLEEVQVSVIWIVVTKSCLLPSDDDNDDDAKGGGWWW